MEILGRVECWLLTLSIALRFLRSIQIRSRRPDFIFARYFSTYTIMVWVIHIIVSYMYVYLLPTLLPFIKIMFYAVFGYEMPYSDSVNVLIIMTIGYTGYDIFKFLESILKISCIGVKKIIRKRIEAMVNKN